MDLNPSETALTACAIYEGLMHAQYEASVLTVPWPRWPYQDVVDMSPERGGVELYGLVASVAVELESAAGEFTDTPNVWALQSSVWAYDVAEALGARLHAVLKAGTYVSAHDFVAAEFPAIWEAANA